MLLQRNEYILLSSKLMVLCMIFPFFFTSRYLWWSNGNCMVNHVECDWRNANQLQKVKNYTSFESPKCNLYFALLFYRFLDGGGMDLFLNCKERFPNKNDLLRNMMGLLGNVAEVIRLEIVQTVSLAWSNFWNFFFQRFPFCFTFCHLAIIFQRKDIRAFVISCYINNQIQWFFSVGKQQYMFKKMIRKNYH